MCVVPRNRTATDGVPSGVLISEIWNWSASFRSTVRRRRAWISIIALGNFSYLKAAIKKLSALSGDLLPTFSMSSIDSSMIDLLGTYPYHTFAALLFSFMFVRRLNKGRDRRNPNSLPLPPGPKGYPLIGNLFDMPANKPWIVYDEWRKTYGEIYTNDLSSRTLFKS